MNRFKNPYDVEAWECKLEAQIYEAKSMLEELYKKGNISPGTYFRFQMRCRDANEKLRSVGIWAFSSMVANAEKAEEF